MRRTTRIAATSGRWPSALAETSTTFAPGSRSTSVEKRPLLVADGLPEHAHLRAARARHAALDRDRVGVDDRRVGRRRHGDPHARRRGLGIVVAAPRDGGGEEEDRRDDTAHADDEPRPWR